MTKAKNLAYGVSRGLGSTLMMIFGSAAGMAVYAYAPEIAKATGDLSEEAVMAAGITILGGSFLAQTLHLSIVKYDDALDKSYKRGIAGGVAMAVVPLGTAAAFLYPDITRRADANGTDTIRFVRDGDRVLAMVPPSKNPGISALGL